MDDALAQRCFVTIAKGNSGRPNITGRSRGKPPACAAYIPHRHELYNRSSLQRTNVTAFSNGGISIPTYPV